MSCGEFFCGKEGGAVWPWAVLCFGEPLGHGSAAGCEVADEARETFLVRTARALWVPDEVSDAEGSEVLACIPAGEAGDGTAAFVFPEPLTDFCGCGWGNGEGTVGCGSEGEEEAEEEETEHGGEGPRAIRRAKAGCPWVREVTGRSERQLRGLRLGPWRRAVRRCRLSWSERRRGDRRRRRDLARAGRLRLLRR